MKRQVSYDDINKISMLTIFNNLGIEYKRIGSIYRLYDKGEVTSGRTYYPNRNNVHDHSEKGRPAGNVFSFVKGILSLSNREVFKYFSNKL